MHFFSLSLAVLTTVFCSSYAAESLDFSNLKSLEPEARVAALKDASTDEKFGFFVSKFEDHLSENEDSLDEPQLKALKQALEFFNKRDHSMEAAVKKDILNSFGMRRGTELLRAEGRADDMDDSPPDVLKREVPPLPPMPCSCTIVVEDFCGKAGVPGVCTMGADDCVPTEKCVGPEPFIYCDGHCV